MIEKQILEQFEVDKDNIVKISAQTGSGMDDFVTILSSKIDELDLKAPVSGPCEGYILESRSTMAGKGRPATVLVKRGTLNKKDLLIAGETLCKGTAQDTTQWFASLSDIGTIWKGLSDGWVHELHNGNTIIVRFRGSRSELYQRAWIPT